MLQVRVGKESLGVPPRSPSRLVSEPALPPGRCSHLGGHAARSALDSLFPGPLHPDRLSPALR